MGERLNVTRHDFQKSFNRHYKVYKNCDPEYITKSERLLLFYSVECGLKSLMLKEIVGKDSYNDLINYGEINHKKDIVGHNIKAMLSELRIESKFPISKINLKKGASVRPEKFNELWRYGVEIEDKDEELKVEKVLNKIAEYIKVRI